MANLALCFKEKKEDRWLTKHEIGQVTSAAQSARALIHVMTHYALDDDPKGKDPLGVYLNAFNILEWLMEPVTDFLFNQGWAAEQKPKGQTP